MKQPGDDEMSERIKGSDKIICDAGRGTVRCLICGDELPMPIGLVTPWVAGFLTLFSNSHPAEPHDPGRTSLQRIVMPSRCDEETRRG